MTRPPELPGPIEDAIGAVALALSLLLTIAVLANQDAILDLLSPVPAHPVPRLLPTEHVIPREGDAGEPLTLTQEN